VAVWPVSGRSISNVDWFSCGDPNAQTHCGAFVSGSSTITRSCSEIFATTYQMPTTAMPQRRKNFSHFLDRSFIGSNVSVYWIQATQRAVERIPQFSPAGVGGVRGFFPGFCRMFAQAEAHQQGI